MARRNAARLNALIDSILDIWQLEEGAYPDRRTSVAVGTLVADALRLAGPRAQARRLELVGDVPEDLPAAWVDPASSSGCSRTSSATRSSSAPKAAAR